MTSYERGLELEILAFYAFPMSYLRKALFDKEHPAADTMT